jgi:hypothetical protein
MTTLIDRSKAEDLSRAWAARKSAAIEAVNTHLASMNLTMDAVMAATLTLTRRDRGSSREGAPALIGSTCET